MTDPTEAQKQFLDAVREGQDAMVEAVGAWAKSVENLSGTYPPVPEMPAAATPDQVVDNAFDFAAKLLAAQREFAHNLLAAAAPAAGQEPASGPEAAAEATPQPSDG